MSITFADLRFYQSQRMTDNSDGGGRMSGVEIVSGNNNQIFDDLSDVTRAVGGISIRKVFAAVTSEDTSKYLDAGIVVFKEPNDEAQSVILFSTGDLYDVHDDLKNRLEQTISRGGLWNGYLYGPHSAGQRAVVLWQRPYAKIPIVGSRLELASMDGNGLPISQFLWIISVQVAEQTVTDSSGTFTINVITMEISEGLKYNYSGTSPSRMDFVPALTVGLLYDTRYNPNSVALYGISPLTVAASADDYSVRIPGLYAPIIPTAFSETALADVNPGGNTPTLSPSASGTITLTTTVSVVRPDGSWFIGRAAMPQSISLSVSGATITDQAGVLYLGSVVVGSVDYSNGIMRFNASCPDYGTASKSLTFLPAVRTFRVTSTDSMEVTVENQGFVWVRTLTPLPDKTTLEVSYRANNQWYVLTDTGDGVLSGVDSSYGSGRLDLETGTLTLTTGALPDVGSAILFAWVSTHAIVQPYGNPPAQPRLQFSGTFAQVSTTASVVPGSVSISWPYGGTTYTITDESTWPLLSGIGGTGAVDYVYSTKYHHGGWTVAPSVLPTSGTVFTVDYQYQVVETDAITGVPETDYCTITLTDYPIAGPVTLSWRVRQDGADDNTATVYAYVDSNDHVIGFDNPIYHDSDGSPWDLGTLNRTTGELNLETTVHILLWKDTYGGWHLGEGGAGQSGKEQVSTRFYYKAGDPFAATYAHTVSVSSQSETYAKTQIQLPVDKDQGESFAEGSLLLQVGSDTYMDTGGIIYKNPEPDTGIGTAAGTLDTSAMLARITDWTAGVNNLTQIKLQALSTDIAGHPVSGVVFRTPIAPIKSGSIQLRYTQIDGTNKTKDIDGTGLLTDTDCTVTADVAQGVVRIAFGRYRAVSGLSEDELAQPWYNALWVVTIDGIPSIWEPVFVLADSILYNAVGLVFLPPDSTLLGIDAARLPPDGKALIFDVGRLVLVHNTASIGETTLSPTQVIDCGRVNLYCARIEDINKTQLNCDLYTLNRSAGTITMSPSLDLTGYTGPYTVYHTVADLSRVVSTDINGTLSLQKKLSHDYDSGTSRCSGVLYAGTMQARYSNLFAQASWDNVWQDTIRGVAPLAQYNDALYPVGITNAGAYTDRILFRFTSTSAYDCYGERLGYLGSGTTGADFSPLNSLTSETYFTVDYRGWGAGWATGNCLRFNLIGAIYPVDCLRAVQPSDPLGVNYDVELLFVGNVDA